MRAVKNKYILSQKLVILLVLKITTLLVVSRDLTNESERRNEAAMIETRQKIVCDILVAHLLKHRLIRRPLRLYLLHELALFVKTRFGMLLALVGSIFILAPSPIQAGDPTERIRFVVEQGIEILNDPKLQSKKGKQGYLDRLREVVYPLFNFPEMARRSLGFHWRRLSPEDREEFVTLFTDLLERSYASKIDLYDGETVVFTDEVVDDRYARVDSKIVSKKGEEFAVNYKLLRTNGDWRIYDVVVEHISLVNNYRSQFNRVISNSSYEELIRRINQKLQELRGSNHSDKSPT